MWIMVTPSSELPLSLVRTQHTGSSRPASGNEVLHKVLELCEGSATVFFGAYIPTTVVAIELVAFDCAASETRAFRSCV